jgi:serine/threonine protein kinase
MPETLNYTQTMVADLATAPDYREILGYLGTPYVLRDYYLLAGQPEGAQGWILELSAVISQVPALLLSVIPFLVEEGVPFKAVMNRETARNLLHGQLGVTEVGKLMAIFPSSPRDAVRIAARCIDLTKDLQGPRIPTDVHLGGTVYTRYGAFNAVVQADDKGHKTNYMYDPSGNLVKEPMNIPFSLLPGVQWPFGNLAPMHIPEQKTRLQKIYQLDQCLKNDIRGSVFKGIYVKSLFRTGRCVVKQGARYMASEDNGRNMKDRLAWQYHLHKQLENKVPVPKAIAFFEEAGDHYLVLEHIEGVTLVDHLTVINFNHRAWPGLAQTEQRQLLKYFFQVLDIVEKLHVCGYVHRDIQPGNFILHNSGVIYAIDLELAWPLGQDNGEPPFALGTPGYTSPEQARIEQPSVKEDIYGLGALMLTLFTGMAPVKFEHGAALAEQIEILVGDADLVALITQCLSANPAQRPTLSGIRAALAAYQKKFSPGASEKLSERHYDPSRATLLEVVNEALEGLTEPPVLMAGDYWVSRYHHDITGGVAGNKEYTRYPGMLEGLSGVIYLLAKISKSRLVPLPEKVRLACAACTSYVRDEYILKGGAPGSLYYGQYGIALALAKGIEGDLVPETQENREYISKCLAAAPEGPDIATGLAGQGLALLQCRHWLPPGLCENWLRNVSSALQETQKKDGTWDTAANPLSFAGGSAGIAWFLVEYGRKYGDKLAAAAGTKALDFLLRETRQLQALFDARAFDQLQQGRPAGDERTGVILAALKAAETNPGPALRTSIESALRSYPFVVASNNFSQLSGLAGLGELYLEAYRVLGSEEWKSRAGWIAALFTNLRWRRNGGCSWKADDNDFQTADLLVGTGGIIHFLARAADPIGFGCCLLQ